MKVVNVHTLLKTITILTFLCTLNSTAQSQSVTIQNQTFTSTGDPNTNSIDQVGSSISAGTNVLIQNGADVTFDATSGISLLDGFDANSSQNTVFSAKLIQQLPNYVQDKFIIGSISDPVGVLGVLDDSNLPAQLDIFKQAYFNTLTSTNKYIDTSFFIKLPYYRHILTLAGQKGLRCLINPFKYSSSIIDTFITNLNTTQKAGLLGLNLTYGNQDESTEPNVGPIKNYLASYKKLVHGNFLNYVLLYPSYIPTGSGAILSNYANYLDKFLSPSNDQFRNFDVVGFDHYPSLKDGSITLDYFYNLQIIRQKAGNRPMWCYPHSTAEDGTRFIEPNEYSLCFESFCPLAYGAKGLIYFTYSTNGNWGNAIIDLNTAPTSKYAIVKNINRFISLVAGPAIMSDTYLATYHKAVFPANQSDLNNHLIPENSPVIKDIDNANMLVGIFQSQDQTYYDLFLVNKSKSSQSPTIFLNIPNPTKIQISTSYQQLSDSSATFSNLNYSINPTGAYFTAPFLPGEGRMIRVTVGSSGFTSINAIQGACYGGAQSWTLTAKPSHYGATNWQWSIDNPATLTCSFSSPSQSQTQASVSGGGGVTVTYTDFNGIVYRSGLTIYSNCRSTGSIVANVYPNPSKTILNISFAPEPTKIAKADPDFAFSKTNVPPQTPNSVQLFRQASTTPLLTKSKEQISANNYIATFNVEGLSPGIYFVHLNYQTHTETRTVIIK